MKTLASLIILIVMADFSFGQNAPKQDTIKTDNGDLIITFVGHGSLYFTYNGKVIQVDPVNSYGDYTKFPKADLIFITHQHGDHLQAETVDLLRKDGTDVVLTEKCAEIYKGKATIARNGEKLNIQGIAVDVVPAYNIVHKREGAGPFHPKGEGNGYVFHFGNLKVYVAGDTENIPEMANLKNIDIAFLPMNLPYTMTPEMVVDCVKMFKPKVLYPYHFGETNTDDLLKLMKGIDYCEVRIRDMK